MYTGHTYQDWEKAGDKRQMLLAVVRDYKGSKDFTGALEALRYFSGDNVAVDEKRLLKLDAQAGADGRRHAVNREVKGNRIASNYFFRLVVQQNQFLLTNGLQLAEDGDKERLGLGFDTRLQEMGEWALVQGVCYGFWNADHLEVLPAAKDEGSGFVALLDEHTGEARLGVQFWQLGAKRPLHIRLFEEDGVTGYVQENGSGELKESEPKRAYIMQAMTDGLGRVVTGGRNYERLPIVPLYGNPMKRSELTVSIKSKIDLYDVILSDFGDNLERTNDIYWVISNFGGTSDEVIEMLAEINRIKATYTQSDGTGQSTAEPHTLEVPYQARSMALSLLEKALYSDYMGLNMEELTGGSLTNVAIQTATYNLNAKANRYEWMVFDFCQKLLALCGMETESIAFKRQAIANQSEIVTDIYAMRADITQEYALKLNPYVADDDIERILMDSESEKLAGMPTIDALEERMHGERGEEA